MRKFIKRPPLLKGAFTGRKRGKTINCPVYITFSAAYIRAQRYAAYELTNGSLNGTQRQLTVDSGEGVSFEEYYDEYLKADEVLDTGFCYDEAFYTDEACTVRYNGGAIKADTSLYYGEYGGEYCAVTFICDGESYVIYRIFGEELSAEDFALSAYGVGEAEDYSFFSDEACNSPVDISQLTAGDITIYVK